MPSKRVKSTESEIMPVGNAEDVEFAIESVDEDDKEALQRAEEADRRQSEDNG